MTNIEQLKAAALAATNRMQDRWPTLKNCLHKDGYLPVFSDYIDAANPATILALIERLQVAEEAEKWANPSNMIKIQAFYLEGHEPFITSIQGHAPKHVIVDIEKDLLEYEDLFKHGDGDYLFEATYQSADHDGPHLLCPAHWELRFIDWRGLASQPDTTESGKS